MSCARLPLWGVDRLGVVRYTAIPPGCPGTAGRIPVYDIDRTAWTRHTRAAREGTEAEHGSSHPVDPDRRRRRAAAATGGVPVRPCRAPVAGGAWRGAGGRCASRTSYSGLSRLAPQPHVGRPVRRRFTERFPYRIWHLRASVTGPPAANRRPARRPRNKTEPRGTAPRRIA